MQSQVILTTEWFFALGKSLSKVTAISKNGLAIGRAAICPYDVNSDACRYDRKKHPHLSERSSNEKPGTECHTHDCNNSAIWQLKWCRLTRMAPKKDQCHTGRGEDTKPCNRSESCGLRKAAV